MTSREASTQIRVVGLVGSLRAGSATQMAVEYALHGALEEGATIALLDLGAYRLPFLGQENDADDLKRIERFRADLREADGIIIGSPEIHGSFSGVLKNALDLAGSEEFEEKMVGLVSLAGGRMGAAQTLSHMRDVVRSLHAWVVPTQASIGDSSRAFDAHREPVDAEVRDRLKAVGKNVARFC